MNELATIEPLTQALALATEAGDINALRDVQAFATSMQKGARARGMGIEAENKAAEVILRAERAMGVVLRQMAESGERATKGAQVRWADPESSPETYASMRLDRNVALNWQRLARMDDARFEELLSEHRAKGERIAKVNFYRDTNEEVRKRAAKEIRELLTEDDAPTSAFETFHAAVDGMVAAMSQTPDDELDIVAEDIKRLYEAWRHARG